jgi:hypothetical protein
VADTSEVSVDMTTGSCKYGRVPRVGVFISWSGNSRGVAEALHEWLPTALHSVEPWMSAHDIHLGTRFLEEIDHALLSCQAGIICVTPENSGSIWVAFEAGVLASRVASKKLVIPLITRMRPSDVPGPLGMFQACELTKPDLLKVIKHLNELNVDADKIPEKRLTATFEGVWPELEQRIPGLESQQTETGQTTVARKSDTELLEESLEVSKSIRIMLEDRLRSIGNPTEIAAASRSIDAAMSSGAGLEGREGLGGLASHIVNASEIWLAGISLEAVMRHFYRSFAESLVHEKVSLRFMLLDPEDKVLMGTAARSLYGVSAIEDLQQDISVAVNQVNQLRELCQAGNPIQLRFMRNFPSTSLIMVNPLSGSGAAIAEFYPYRTSSSDRPHIILNESNLAERKWFLFYREQFLSMWRDARIEVNNNEQRGEDHAAD